MGSQGPGRKRIPNRNGLTAEEDALNIIAKEAEARLAAKRAARAEAREIRMKELERQQKEIYQVQKKYYGLDNLDNKWGDIEQWMENNERYTRHSQRHGSVSDDEEQISVRIRSSLRSNGYDDYSTISSQGSLYEDSFYSSSWRSSTQASEYSGVLGLSSRTSSSSVCASALLDDTDRDVVEKGPSQASTSFTATLASLGSCRGSGDSTVTADPETSMQEIKEIHELKDQIQDVEAKYMQSLKDVKDSLVEMEEKYRKAMVSNAQLDNEKTNLMYQVDTLKDSLMELEEFLGETRRESAEKSKHLEREKHAYSILHFQFNELKETLKQSEELLSEIRQLQLKQDGFIREISDLQETIDWKNKKIGALERQKEYSDAIRNERDELRDEVVQLKDILKKHGIVFGPDISINQEAGAHAAVPQGSTVLGPQEFQLGRDGNVGSCREDQDQQSKDLDYEMQNIRSHPNVSGKFMVAHNDEVPVNLDFGSHIENNAVFSKSEFRDMVKTKHDVLQNSKGKVLELVSAPLTKGTLTIDQQESSVAIKNNEIIKQESPGSTNNAFEVCLVSKEDTRNAQAKKSSEESLKIDKNASYSQSAKSSSKKKKKKKKNKQKQSEKKDTRTRDNNENQLKEDSTAQRREFDPECVPEFGEASMEVSINEKVTTNLNKEQNMDPKNKNELQNPKLEIDTVTGDSKSVSQNQPDLQECMIKSDFISALNGSKTKTEEYIPIDDIQKQITTDYVKDSADSVCNDFLDIPSGSDNTELKLISNINDTFSLETKSDYVAFQNISRKTENRLVVRNKREISQVVNDLVENKTHSQVLKVNEFQYDEVEKKQNKHEKTTQEDHTMPSWPEDYQYGKNFAVHCKGEKTLLEDLCGESKLNTTEEIFIHRGVGGTLPEHKQYMDMTAVQLPGAEPECQGHAYTVQNMEDEVEVQCEESFEIHNLDFEVSSDVGPQFLSVEPEMEVTWSKGKLYEGTEQQKRDKHEIGQKQINCEQQKLIAAHHKVDQISQMNKQDCESLDGEQITVEQERCITEEQQILTEEQSVNLAQGHQ
ncbi:uncharacterized protein lrrfip1a isoform X4 [Brachyhypopomus gauderio]|uniref:uncharacterized protein lrrfip1a isoform X4 n=1 Tax=Brachyhypopomus gauderio TaxID=698409 RepID=UPI00404192C5